MNADALGFAFDGREFGASDAEPKAFHPRRRKGRARTHGTRPKPPRADRPSCVDEGRYDGLVGVPEFLAAIRELHPGGLPDQPRISVIGRAPQPNQYSTSTLPSSSKGRSATPRAWTVQACASCIWVDS